VVGVIELIVRADHLWVENVPSTRRQGRDSAGACCSREAEARRLGLARFACHQRALPRNIAMYLHYGYVETTASRTWTDLVHYARSSSLRHR